MKSKMLFIVCTAWITLCTFANGTPTRYEVNLNEVTNDELKVTVWPASSLTGDVLFRMPKIVPGTYSIYDFGRFVTSIEAITKSGKPTNVEKVDVNTWKIKTIENIERIIYSVEDTWDTKDKSNWVFEPAGTNFEEGKNFVLNNHGIFGYFEGTTSQPLEITIIRPENFYGSSGLTFTQQKDRDIYQLPDYHKLIDSPIMYCVPDTTIIRVGNTSVLISVYNDNKSVTSAYISRQIEPILNGIKDYLGGKLPVDKYAFILYLPSTFTSFGFGALEHNNSSMYYLPAMGGDYLGQMVKDVSAHEFFHIVTPLTIHSEEIQYFDYNNPKMSKHLWLYEGVTEYSAHHVQVRNGQISMEQFLDVIQEKISGASGFNDTLPFTVMSKGCLDTYKDQYLNVYQKGALIAMCLDLKLIQLSNGAMDLPKLMKKLSLEFGHQKPFKDDELFDVITRLTYPEIGEFLKKHVGGNQPLPLEEYLMYAGITYSAGGTQEITDFGLDFENAGYDEKTDRFYIISETDLSPVGKALGLRSGDVILKINGKELKMETALELYLNLYMNSKPADVLKYEIGRPNKKGKLKKIILKGKVGTQTIQKEERLASVENPTSEQLMIRKAWLGQ
jgi:predicted metalloprotease with PDZ domain